MTNYAKSNTGFKILSTILKPVFKFWFGPKLIGKEIDGTVITGSDVFAEKFLEVEKVAVVPGKSFGTDIHVRWSYATSMENINKGLDRLEAFIAKLK